MNLLPTVDETETRRKVKDYFKLYRQRKMLLSMDFEAHAKRRADPNDARQDPSTIRAPYKYSDGMREEFDIGDDPIERQRKYFVRDVEHKVKCLPDYQKEIIQRCYMVSERPGTQSRLPSNEDVYAELCGIGWYVSDRYYREQKREAIMILAEAWRIIQYVQEEEVI